MRTRVARAQPLGLRPGDRDLLESWTRSSSIRAWLAQRARIVLRTWRHHRVQPWRTETFKFSTDPELVAKVTDVDGLYLNPPENAIVLSVDEKSQIRA